MRIPTLWFRSLIVVLIAAVMVLPASALLASASVPSPSPPAHSVPSTSPLTVSELGRSPPAAFPYGELGRSVTGVVATGVPPAATAVPVLLTFQFSNASRLSGFLTSLQDPRSPQFHHYLSAAQFDSEFGEPTSTYNAAVQYLESVGATDVQGNAGRIGISFDVTPSVADGLFHTTLATYQLGGGTFYAPTSAPELPAALAGHVAGVTGLSSYSLLVNHPLLTHPTFRSSGHPTPPPPIPPISAYPTPVTMGGVQYEFGSDFQVAYDQLSLFEDQGYPTNVVAATILSAGLYEGSPISTPWGNLSTNQAVGPFVPKDINDYYNETIPVGEPHATVTGVPVDGAPAPGPLASYDSTSANVENTLDLEMLGSTAPGASIYNVYGPTLSDVDADDAFSFILNPNASYPALANVSVISNSWGGTDAFDPGWNASTATAAARGITVLAASGDSGSNPLGDGGGFDPPGQTTFFPASLAYNAYGDVAVGGTTVTLDTSTLQLTSDIVWNESTGYTAPNPAAGSTGGISTVFPAPDWQNSTSANNLTQGLGRGVPDVAAVANNTIMTLSVDGTEYQASNASLGQFFIQVAGTSIASPLTAGMIAEADHVLGSFHDPGLGFLDPTLYPLADQQYASVPAVETPATGFFVTGTYDSSLPTTPFYDVTQGQNFAASALPGYDLVTGWGTIDAYNFTMYFATDLPVNTPGALSSVQAEFNLTGLDVSSTSPYYNASLQQNFFVADALGAPIYWVQNVVYINGTPGAWNMNFSGWVVYPFWGLYPSDTIYEYNFPVTGQVLGTPLSFDIVTTLENTTVVNGQSVQFSFGVAGAAAVTLPLPGGSYILGQRWNNYSWGGVDYSNNPLESGGAGSLSPQFGLVGGPSGGLGTFVSPTAGDLQLTFQRFGSATWVPGATASYGESIDQTGESSTGLVWTLQSPANFSAGTPANWSLSVSSGSTDQGVFEYDPASFVPTVPVTFSENGLPNGKFWSVTLGSGQNVFTPFPTATFDLANGTYTWMVSPPRDFSVLPQQGTIVVDGAALNVTLQFTLVLYNVTLDALALPIGFTWWANVTVSGDSAPSIRLTTSATNVTFESPNNTLDVTFAAQYNWTGQPSEAQFTVDGAPVVYGEAFGPPPKFTITFAEQGLPAGANWTLNVSGLPHGITTNSSGAALTLVNGSYTYVGRAGVSGYFDASGAFGVDGVAHEVIVSFLPAVYAVSFTESGLPNGTLWGVQITDGPFLSSSGPSLVWTAVNGTYSYTVLSEVAGWTATPLSVGTFDVQGAGVGVAVQFVLVTYPVTFYITGLPSGSTWGVSLNGASEVPTTAPLMSFNLANGSYSYTVTVPSGWTSTPASGTLLVSGLTGSVALQASPRTATSTNNGPLGLGGWGYALIGLIALAVLVVVASVALTRRPPPPPTDGAPEGTYQTSRVEDAPPPETSVEPGPPE